MILNEREKHAQKNYRKFKIITKQTHRHARVYINKQGKWHIQEKQVLMETYFFEKTLKRDDRLLG